MRTRDVVWMGLLWALALVGFQLLVSARYAPERPDRVLEWTPDETGARSHDRQPYLLDPLLRQLVAWDSEFYLSIAVHGYDDPAVRSVEVDSRQVSLNYAFFPLYPAVMRVLSRPLAPLLGRVGAATLAGVIASVLGAIGAAVSLFWLVRADGPESRAWKAAFFFLAFPSSFFLLQVYAEGLFAGLAFGSMALARHRQVGWAAFLAVLATWTGPGGACLVLPVAWAGWEGWRERRHDRAALAGLLFALAPVAAFLAWRLSPLGRNFGEVERELFHRGALRLGQSVRSWGHALSQLHAGRPETRVYYGMELAATVAAVGACLATLRRMPGASLFGLAAILVPSTSGEAQGSVRFVLAVPSLFVVLGRMGEWSEVLDRAWTVASVLLLGMMATLFTFDMWVG
jgi:hypothetical protein